MTTVSHHDETKSTGLCFPNKNPWNVATTKFGIDLQTVFRRRRIDRLAQRVEKIARSLFVVVRLAWGCANDRSFIYPKHIHFGSDMLGQRKAASQCSLRRTRSIKANEHFAIARLFLFGTNDEHATRRVLVNAVSGVTQQFSP